MTTYWRTAAIFFVATLSSCNDGSFVASSSDPANANTDPVIAGDPNTAVGAGRS